LSNSGIITRCLEPNAEAAESVHLADWSETGKSRIANSKSLIAQMSEVRRLVSVALAKRAEAGIGSLNLPIST